MPLRFLYHAARWLAVGLLLFIPTVAAGAEQRPNILLMLADDLTWHDLGCYGNQQVHTPHLDRLAAQGMRLTHAFTATAMCAPTRQQLYTGLFPVRNGAYPNHSKVKPGTKSMVHYFKDLGYRVGLSGKTHFGPPASFPFEKLKGDVLDGVDEFIRRDPKQPFCLVVCSHNPHVKWTTGDPSRYDPAKLKLPPYLVDTPETRIALARYYAEVGALDDEMGQVLKWLDASGQADNTIVVFTSEQGAQFPHGKWTCYDVGLRTDMLVRWPGKIRANSTSDAMVQYVDVVPTLIEAVGGNSIEGLDGRSFLSVLTGKAKSHREVVYGVHTTQGIIAGRPYPIRSIRDRRYKYIWNLNADQDFHNTVIASDAENYWKSWVAAAAANKQAAHWVQYYQHRPAEEFYDLDNDPYELHNLADQPENRQRMDALRKQLEAWMKQQGDQGMATELAGKRNKA